MEEQPSSLPTGTVLQGPTIRPLYFSASPLKLVLMSICTFGIYELYWFYRNWCYVKDREPDIMPFWRAFFSTLFCYSLFRKVQQSEESQFAETSVVPIPLAIGWIVLTFLVRLPDPFWLVSFLSVFCLVPVQVAINEINIARDPQCELNGRFSGWNIAAIVIGGLLLLTAVIGIFQPGQ